MLVQFGKKIYGRYAFADAFNPTTGWVSQHVIGIDVGITLLSAENLRTGSVWQWFMSNPEAERALDLVGLRKNPVPHASEPIKAAGLKPDAPGQPAAEKPQPDILITSDAAIPASFFQFKIPIPIEPAQPPSPPQDAAREPGPGGPNASQHR
jgi:hypothetical protein